MDKETKDGYKENNYYFISETGIQIAYLTQQKFDELKEKDPDNYDKLLQGYLKHRRVVIDQESEVSNQDDLFIEEQIRAQTPHMHHKHEHEHEQEGHSSCSSLFGSDDSDHFHDDDSVCSHDSQLSQIIEKQNKRLKRDVKEMVKRMDDLEECLQIITHTLKQRSNPGNSSSNKNCPETPIPQLKGLPMERNISYNSLKNQPYMSKS